MAINLLTEDPRRPSGAYWFWSTLIPKMAERLEGSERIQLIASPAWNLGRRDLGPGVELLICPWSNENRRMRVLTEHLYFPLRLPLTGLDVLSTSMAPIVNPRWSLVIHMKTMHAYTEPRSVSPLVRTYRRLEYPRSARLADAVVINSLSLRSEVQEHLGVDERKLRLVYEAVDHDVFRPGDAGEARAGVAKHGLTRPFVLFVSSLWRYKNCDGLLRAWARVRPGLGGRQLAVVGNPADDSYAAELRSLAGELGIAGDVVFVGPVSQRETAAFYRAADALVYPSFNETFGLPILEAMACGCPVITSNRASMPEIAGDAAVLVDPGDPEAIGSALVNLLEGDRTRLRNLGLRRAARFTWAATAAATLDVYREVTERRRARSR